MRKQGSEKCTKILSNASGKKVHHFQKLRGLAKKFKAELQQREKGANLNRHSKKEKATKSSLHHHHDPRL